MIVDTSAIVAIALGETGAEDLREALAHSPNSRISAPSYVELCAVLQRRNRPEIGRMVDRLLAAYGIEIETFDAEQARVAAQAYRDYGRGSGQVPGSTSGTVTAMHLPTSPESHCCSWATTSFTPTFRRR